MKVRRSSLRYGGITSSLGIFEELTMEWGYNYFETVSSKGFGGSRAEPFYERMRIVVYLYGGITSSLGIFGEFNDEKWGDNYIETVSC